MSTALKWVIAIIVLAGAGWLLWYSGWFRSTSNTMQASVATSTATTTAASSTAAVPQNGMTVANDSSDAAIAQDAAAVDVQMQALGADNSQVTASLSDKPIVQSY